MQTEEPGWQHRLESFLGEHASQLEESETVLVFKGRSTDDKGKMESIVRTNAAVKGQVLVKLGETQNEIPGQLSPVALEAILKRARLVFENNKHPAKLRRGYDYHFLSLRPGDRLSRLPGSEKFLETALVELEDEMDSHYLTSGAYSTETFERGQNSGDGLSVLRKHLNRYPRALPLPLAEALYKGEQFELDYVHDEVANPGLRTDSFPPLSEGDSVGIVAWTKNTEQNGQIWGHGEGFHIGHNDSHIIPATVSKVEGDTIHLNDSSYQMKIKKGRLYLRDFGRFGNGKTWTSVGPWNNETFNVPDDETAYQILKVHQKQG